ncbi:taspase, threonine aspartase, 1, partial [Podila humilis]
MVLACLAGIEQIRSNPDATATQVVVHMISILEDDPITNAGYGSNLNLDGVVECDASIMNGTTLGFGAIGAVSDFRNPIKVAATVLVESDLGPLSLGRIPPLLLVGPGVAHWVDTMGHVLDRVDKTTATPKNMAAVLESTTLESVGLSSSSSSSPPPPPPSTLVSKTALEQYLHYNELLQQKKTVATGSTMSTVKRKLVEDNRQDSTKKPTTATPISQLENENENDRDLLNDTVGAICVDRHGRIASGVSSGGIALKFPGRVSEAALFGAGCWAQDATTGNTGFACSVTGAGEQITKTLLAKSCMDQLSHDDDTAEAAQRVLDRFITDPLLRSYPERHAGFIAVKLDPTDEGQPSLESRIEEISDRRDTAIQRRGEFVYAHTTPTM